MPWLTVYDKQVYRADVGTLTNSAVSEVVSKILMLEDIREDDAHSLETLLAVFSDDVRREVVSPISLVHELPLAKLVPSWARLQETRFLTALVIEITVMSFVFCWNSCNFYSQKMHNKYNDKVHWSETKQCRVALETRYQTSTSFACKWHSPSRLAWSWVGGRLVPFYIHQMNRVNSRNGSAMMTAP